MPSIFDNPAPALFQNPQYAGLLSAYDPLEQAFRAAYAPPPAGTSIYRPGQAGSMPGGPQTPVYQPGPASIWDSGGNGVGGTGPGGGPGPAPSANDVQSQMGSMGALSPASLAMSAVGMVNPALGMVNTIGKVANMLGPPANMSPDVIAMVNNPVALANTLAVLDPDGTQAIAPTPGTALFDLVIAMQHANSGGGVVGSGSATNASADGTSGNATGPGGSSSTAGAPNSTGANGGIAVGPDADAQQNNDQGTSAGASGADGATVICTELHRRGWLDEATYQDDVIFGMRQTDEVVAGYHLWAKPYVRLMQRPGIVGALATALAVAIALPWAKAMRASVRGQRGPVAGRIIMAVGLPICRWLGRDRGRAVLAAE